jgi:surface antigen
MRRRRPLLVVAVGIVAAGVAATSSRGAVITYGYSYARNCPDAGFAHAVDRWGMYECNCTSYVAWALHANGRRTDWFVPGAMDAWNWPNVAEEAGLSVGTTPRRAAVAVWPKLDRPFGHVALVTSVKHNGRFDVAEYNYPALGWFEPFVFDIRRDVSPAGAVFVYVPRRLV